MEINVIRVVYYGLCMIGISWYMLNRIKEGLCEEDLDWFVYVSILSMFLVPSIIKLMEVVK